MEPVLDLPVSFLVSPAGVSRTDVDLEGLADAQGRRVWSLSNHYADDQIAKVQATAITEKWYANSFPAGHFVAPLDLAGSTDAVYAHSTNALVLLGYASAVENPPEGRTLVVYAAPVAVYRFPIAPGQHWTSVGEVRNQLVRGLPYAGRDTYDIRIDAAGRLELPDLTFTQALRSRTALLIEPALGPSPISRKQVSWLFECFGEVARATSATGEAREDFTTTSELRRLGY